MYLRSTYWRLEKLDDFHLLYTQFYLRDSVRKTHYNLVGSWQSPHAAPTRLFRYPSNNTLFLIKPKPYIPKEGEVVLMR